MKGAVEPLNTGDYYLMYQPFNQPAQAGTAPPQGQVQINPMAPPFVVPVEVSFQMQNMLPMFTGYAMYELYAHAGKNPLRAFLLDVMGQNNWNNQEFPTFVQGVAQLAEFFVGTQRMQPQVAIQTAATEMASMMTALKFFQNQQQLGPYVNPQQLQELQNLMGRFQHLQGQMAAFFAPPAQMGQVPMMGGYPPMGYPAPGMGRGPNIIGGPTSPSMGGYFGPPMAPQVPRGLGPNQGAGMWGQPIGPNVSDPRSGSLGLSAIKRPNNGNNQQIHDPAPPAHEQRTHTHSPSTPNTAIVEEMSFPPHKPVEPRRASQAPVKPTGTREIKPFPSFPGLTPAQVKELSNPGHAPHPPVQPQTQQQQQTSAPAQTTHVSVNADSEWPKIADPTRPWDSILLQDGSEMRPACISGWQKSWTEDEPYRLVYDYTQYVLFHLRKPDGTVLELLKEKEESMNYLDNELDPKLREQAKKLAEDPSKKIVPDWNLAKKLKQFPGQPFSATPEAIQATDPTLTLEDVEAIKPTLIEEAIVAASPAEAQVKLKAILRAVLGRDSTADEPIEYYVDMYDFVPVESSVTNTVRLMDDALTLDDLYKRMHDSRHLLPEVVWDAVDKRVTYGVNKALQMNMSLAGWSIDSFVTDYKDLMVELEKTYGKKLAETLNDYGVEISGTQLSALPDHQHGELYKNLTGQDLEEGQESGLLVFIRRESVTRVPWKLSDLHLDVNNGGLILEDKMPNLYSLADSIFGRTEDMPVTFAHRFIKTSDGATLELRRGYLVKDGYLLYKV